MYSFNIKLKKFMSGEYLAINFLTLIVCTSAQFSRSNPESGPGWHPENSILGYDDTKHHKQPCRDAPIEMREQNASIIFTGTVRELEADWSEPGGVKRAKVEVKRVMKGGFLLSRVPRVSRDEEGLARRGRRIVVVEGIGNGQICDSDTKVYDTKIFLVSVTENGQLRLNSSLVRITLENIEQAEAAIKGRLSAEHKSQTSEKNSTTGHDKDRNRSTGLVTHTNHVTHSRSTTSPRRVDRTILTYSEAPRLRETSTTYRTSTREPTKSTTKPTTTTRAQTTTTNFRDPCQYKNCSHGATCQYDPRINPEPRCVCPQACPLNYAPVCGTDGVTYPNQCSLIVTACTTQTEISIDRRYPGECPHPDPCATKTCHYGAQCVPSADGRSAGCMCVERCESHGDDSGSGPVCGTDGRDYRNECEMKKAACKDMRVIEKKFDGKCDPCEGLECSASQVCHLDMSRRAVCRCDPDLCPMTFDPVCGSDGKTYSTECIMRVDACRRRRDVQLLYRGECSSGNNPCSDMICSSGQHCMVNNHGLAQCLCPMDCEPIYRPVCGSDGRTYDSECHLAEYSCTSGQHVTISFMGECNKVGPCATHRCQHGAQCVIRNNQPRCVCPTCTEEFKPVCGTNDLTYTKECKLRSEVCLRHTDVTIAFDGTCDPCRKKQCDFYSTCESDGQGSSRCECPSNCDQVENRVCGTDGQTYLNECEMKMKSCHLQQLILVSSQGPCDPCANVDCKHGSVCEMGRCVCQRNCASDHQPVCASDGATYPNECSMRYAGCSQSINIEVMYPGECEVSSGSGDIQDDSRCDSMTCKFGGTCRPDRYGVASCQCDFNCDALRSPVCGSDGRTYGNECHLKEESCKRQSGISVQPMDYCGGFDIDEELCDGKPPMVSSSTGREFNCLPGQDVCPAGSYCHNMGSIARCCRQDTDTLKSCVESRYGCCSDGISQAQGPNELGCPKTGECQCNALGSNGTHCDPATRQCPCKYGVGGLRCDRCQPSYWGLPLISEGNSGCLACLCNEHGSLRADCEQMTGRCVCRPGVSGQKCDVCSNGKPLGSEGCSDMMQNDRLEARKACTDKMCQYGAVCEISSRGQAECVCPTDCIPGEDRQNLVCATDGQTYGSVCQLKLFACRLQRDIRPLHYGSCGETTSTSAPPVSSSHREGDAHLNVRGEARSRITKDINNPNKYSKAFGMLNDFCQMDKGCYVENSHCSNGLCVCKSPLKASEDNLMCIGERRL